MATSAEIRKAYAEVYTILSFVDEYYMDRVSNKFIEYIYKQKDDSYIPKIDLSIPLEQQNLLEDTVNILALIKYNYWCEDENEKKELVNFLIDNEQKYQDALKEIYNPDDIFKDIEKKDTVTQDLIVYRENIFKKIFNKIKQILKFRK